MRILHLLVTGGIGGIEVLCRDIGLNDHKNDNIFCFLCGEGPIFDEMTMLGLKTVSLDNVGGGVSYKKLKQLKKLAVDVDVIAIHHGTIHNYLYFKALKRIYPDKKYIMYAHFYYEKKYVYPKNKLKMKLFVQMLKKALFQADCICFVSKAGRKSYVEAFPNINIQKTAIVYNGISDDLIELAQDNVPCFHETFEILYIGRLVEIKGIHLLLKAVSKLQHENYKIHLTILGDGDFRKELEKQVDDDDMVDIVSFEGMQRAKDKYYRKANIFVYPSVCQEVFGISIVEAMAYGLLCIANRVGGIPEIIVDGENGFLTKEITVEEIYKAILKAMQCYKTGQFSEISQKCKKTASNFSIQNTVRDLQEVYH